MTRSERAPKLWKLALAALLVLAVSPVGPAQSHPHVWVKVQSQVLYDDKGRVSGLRHTWTFDEFYSTFAVQGMDTDRDGAFSQAELKPLAAENVSSLQEFDYFTFVKADGKVEERAEPRDYRLDHVDGILTLHFTLPLKTPLDPVGKKVTFAVYDPTYFVAFSFDETNPVMLAANAPRTCQAKFKETKTAQARLSDMGEAFYSSLDADSEYGSQFARTVAINCGTQ